MIAHIFDLDTLIKLDLKPWIIDKNNPNIPLLKLDISDYDLIKNGVYKNQNNKIEYNNKIFWLPNILFNKLKVIAKNKKIGMSDMAISLQEFLNKDIINKKDFIINFNNISQLKNNEDDIFLLCSNNAERYLKDINNKIIEKLKEDNIIIKKIYYINDTHSNTNTDKVNYKKSSICLEQLIGYKIDNDKFIDNTTNKYSKVYFYDNNFDTLKMSETINNILYNILSKTDKGLKDVIKEDIKESKSELIVNKITDNTYNKFITKKVKIIYSNLIKTFESFNVLNPLKNSK